MEIQTALRAPQLEADPAVTSAYGVVVRTLVHIIGELNTHVAALCLLEPRMDADRTSGGV